MHFCYRCYSRTMDCWSPLILQTVWPFWTFWYANYVTFPWYSNTRCEFPARYPVESTTVIPNPSSSNFLKSTWAINLPTIKPTCQSVFSAVAHQMFTKVKVTGSEAITNIKLFVSELKWFPLHNVCRIIDPSDWKNINPPLTDLVPIIFQLCINPPKKYMLLFHI